MKKKFGKFFVILLTSLTLGLSACNLNQPTGPTETEVALAEAKSTAIAQVDAWDLSVYREAEKTTLQLAIATFKTEVNAANSEEEVTAALNKVIEVKNGLKTAAQYEAEEAAAAATALAEAKSTAKTALESYAVATDYEEDNWARVQTAIANGKQAIDAAESVADVNEALANAKAAIDAIAKKPTADEIALQNAKTSAKTEVSGWDVNLYRETDKATLEAAIAVFNREVAAAVTISEVTNALNKVKEVKNGLKTAAEHDAEEAAAAALAKAKSDAKAEIEGYAKEDEYTSENWQTLLGVVTAAKAAIDAATSIDVVSSSLSTAKNAIDAIEKKPQTPIEETLLKAMENLYNYTATITYKDGNMNMTSVTRFTGYRYRANATGAGDTEYSYAQIIAQMGVANWEAAKPLFESNLQYQEQMTGGAYHYTPTYDDANQKVILHIELVNPYTTYVDYDEDAEQFYFYVYGGEMVDEFSYLLDSEAAIVENGYFVSNAPLFATLISAENYDAQSDSYSMDDERILYLIGGNDMAQFRAKNFRIRFDNGMPKEFTFAGYNGFAANYVDYKVVFSDFGTTEIDVPQITLKDCDHKFCEIGHDVYEGRGHRDYCSRCHKYLGQIEEHNFDNTYKVCTECLYVNSNEEYVNPNYISVDGVPFVKFVKSVDGKNFVTGEFSTQVGDSAGIIYGQGYAMQYIVEKATNKLALVKYGVGELLEGKTCEYAQANELKLYVFDFEANLELFRTKWSDNQIFAQRYVENPETGEWGYVTDSSTLNYEFLIAQILAGGLDPDLKQFAFFEENAAKVCEEAVYSTYHRHDDQYKIDLSNPCDRIEYHQCRNCNEFTSIPTHYDNHAWGEEYSLIATPSGFEGAVFFERECINCHKKQTLFIPANQMSQAQYHTQNSTSCIIYQPGSSATTYTSLQLCHLYNGNHQCVLCGQKEITSISVGEGVIKNEYELRHTPIGISEITVNYYDGSHEVVPLRDEQTGFLNFDIEISKDKASETITHENQTLNDGDLVGDAKLVINYQGVKLERNITVTPEQRELQNLDCDGIRGFAFAGEEFEIVFRGFGQINQAELSFFDQNSDPVDVTVTNQRVVPDSENEEYNLVIATLETEHIGMLVVRCEAEGPHDSHYGCDYDFNVAEIRNITPAEELTFNYIRGLSICLGQELASFEYRDSTEGAFHPASFNLIDFLSEEEANSLDEGPNNLSIDVFGETINVVINVKSVVSIDAFMDGPNANPTEFAYEDEFNRQVYANITYSDDSTEELYLNNVFLTNPNDIVDPEMPVPEYYYWDRSGTWTVHYSYLGVENTYDITVAERIPVELTDFEIIGPDSVLIGMGSSLDLSKTPYNGDVVDIEWINNTPSVISIDPNGEECRFDTIGLGQASVTVNLTNINGETLTDTYVFNVTNTIFPTSAINEFLGDGFDIPAFVCTDVQYDVTQTDFYFIRGYFPDLMDELDELGWDVNLDEENGILNAFDPDYKIAIIGNYMKGESWYDLYIYDNVVLSNLIDFREVGAFTCAYLDNQGMTYYDPEYGFFEGETHRTYTIVVETPAIEYDDLESESVQQLLETLKEGLYIDGYTGLTRDDDLSLGYIGYYATYHNLTINVYIFERNPGELYIRYQYYYQIPNAQVNP